MAARTLITANLLWDGHTSMATHHAAVLIEAGRIVDAGHVERFEAAKRSPDVTHVDFPDATLMPGLVDMHIHLDDDGWTPLRLLANGITTVRDTGNNHHALIDLRHKQSIGEWIGPHIVTFGPLIDAAPAHWPHVAQPVHPNDDVEAIVDKIIDAGVDGLKTYAKAPPWLVERVVKHAISREMPVTCHCGACKASQALGFGMGCVEHVMCLDVLEPNTMWHQLKPDSPRIGEMINLFQYHGAWFTPTLAVMEAVEHFWGRRLNDMPGFDQYPPYVVGWIKQYLAAMKKADDWDAKRVALADLGFERMLQLVKRFHEAKIPMLAGSDSPFVPVGLGFHYELELLERAGIDTRTVLKMATHHAAEYLKDSTFGTIAPGKRADLIAIKGNPLLDIRCTRDVLAVWQSGHHFDPQSLHAQADLALAMTHRQVDPARPAFGIPFVTHVK